MQKKEKSLSFSKLKPAGRAANIQSWSAELQPRWHRDVRVHLLLHLQVRGKGYIQIYSKKWA